MNEQEVLLKTELPLPPFYSGKVRDTYQLGERLLMVVTDRISAFDFVLASGIPDKGKVLNQISAFWFNLTRDIVPNHVVEMVDDVSCLERYVPAGARFDYPDYLAGRSMVVDRAERLEVECVVRGYLAGSAWAEYRQSDTVFGKPLPVGLQESQELPEPLFTPTTKAESGHDLPISPEEMRDIVGDMAMEMEAKSLAIYNYAREYARQRGIIIADTKMEFGTLGGQLILIDELLTPDSSRFWDMGRYQVGMSQDSYDKQPVRDWLVESGWNKEPPAPALPPEVVAATTERYRTAYERLTGKTLA